MVWRPGDHGEHGAVFLAELYAGAPRCASGIDRDGLGIEGRWGALEIQTCALAMKALSVAEPR
jgi:hypothetical protein